MWRKRYLDNDDYIRDIRVWGDKELLVLIIDQCFQQHEKDLKERCER